jgi:hypothetical protein
MTIESSDKLLFNNLQKHHSIAIALTRITMYKSKFGRSLLDVALPAALGAGVVTSFAIAQGQHPAIAIGITAISTTFVVVCYRFDLI